MKKILLFAFILLSLAELSCAQTVIVYGENATPGEKHAAQELYKDIDNACGQKSILINYTQGRLPIGEKFVFIGTKESNPFIKDLAGSGKINVSSEDPGPEAFILQSIDGYPEESTKSLVIAGSDERGTLYGTYEFSRRHLGIDPYEYWTGKRPPECAGFEIPDISLREQPPVFPLRGYFDNDSDMIANWKGEKLIIEFDTWKEIIDSLARLRYNYIDLHDTLGRAEFWTYPFYKDMTDYHTDLDLIDKIIDYAHSKGMLVQIPMYLGWEFYHLPIEKLCLSRYHDDWMAVYEYYMTQTPLGKADLFLQRPRDPWKDKGYKCQEEIDAGIQPGPLMTEMFNGLARIVKKHRPDGIVICDLWAEGRQMWDSGTFDPDKQIQMLWADGGYANYSKWIEDKKGHDFGIYIHAGYFLNHVIQDPYPGLIKEATLDAIDHDMTNNYFVNGQDFKHFILNLEACARSSWNPDSFDPEAFYLEWTGRYFGEKAAATIVESLKALHRSTKPVGGFTRIMTRTVEMVDNLRYLKPVSPDLEAIEATMEEAKISLSLAEEAEALVPPESALAFDDQILFPAKIMVENIKLNYVIAKTTQALIDRNDKELTLEQRKAAKAELKKWKSISVQQLIALRKMLEEGSKWDKWEGWTHPDNFRCIKPPPDIEDLERIVRSLQ
ncbi:MAG TPA: glycosyl hydrolase 115 family protein [bacterium]|nr:glycosyl hydrolase 115 family protein [bacterium]